MDTCEIIIIKIWFHFEILLPVSKAKLPSFVVFTLICLYILLNICQRKHIIQGDIKLYA